MKTPDKDVRWLLDRATEEADLVLDMEGPGSDGVMEARRAETVTMRLAREAGYDLRVRDLLRDAGTGQS